MQIPRAVDPDHAVGYQEMPIVPAVNYSSPAVNF